MNKARIREEVEKLRPIDDIMFRKMAEDKAFCQELLQVILGDKQLVVEKSEVQWSGNNLQGRSVIMDCLCHMGDGRVINIEVQRANNDDSQKRVRYNGAVLTTNITDPGKDFKSVPDICIIFIAEYDIFGKDLSLYHVDRVVRETGEVVANGMEEIYVYAGARNDTEVSALMQVFTEKDTYDDRFPVISGRKQQFKGKGSKEETHMSDSLLKLMEEEREAGIKAGMQAGMQAGRDSLIESLRAIGISEEQINKALATMN